jgi:hypothetical protein
MIDSVGPRPSVAPRAPAAPCTFLVRDVLERQHVILDDPRRWTRGALARTLLQEAVVPLSDRALSWSLNGALALAMFDVLGPATAQVDWQRVQDAAVDALWSSLPTDHPRTARKMLDLDGFNDFVGHDHADVLDLIQGAIAAQGS